MAVDNRAEKDHGVVASSIVHAIVCYALAKDTHNDTCVVAQHGQDAKGSEAMGMVAKLEADRASVGSGTGCVCVVCWVGS